MAIFPKNFGDIIILIIRVNADERIKKNSDIFSIKDLEYTFVCFLGIQSLLKSANGGLLCRPLYNCEFIFFLVPYFFATLCRVKKSSGFFSPFFSSVLALKKTATCQGGCEWKTVGFKKKTATVNVKT